MANLGKSVKGKSHVAKKQAAGDLKPSSKVKTYLDSDLAKARARMERRMLLVCGSRGLRAARRGVPALTALAFGAGPPVQGTRNVSCEPAEGPERVDEDFAPGEGGR